MAFTMSDVKKGVEQEPRKVLIYGPPKMGKSTLAGSTKGALLIPTEDRVAHIDCDKTPIVKNYDDMLNIFDFILKERHPYKRIIIDTIDWFEPILHQRIVDMLCADPEVKTKPKNITDENSKETNYSRGLKYHAVTGWRAFFARCDKIRMEKGIDFIFVAHSHIMRIELPDQDPYDKYVIKMDKNALSIVEEWADVIAYYDKEIFVQVDSEGTGKKGKAISNNVRKLFLEGSKPSMISGNSYGFQDTGNIGLSDCSGVMEWLLTENENATKKTTKKSEVK